jgi:hypothetical protein
MIRLLLVSGIDHMMLNSEGMTALQVAKSNKREHVVTHWDLYLEEAAIARYEEVLNLACKCQCLSEEGMQGRDNASGGRDESNTDDDGNQARSNLLMYHLLMSPILLDGDKLLSQVLTFMGGIDCSNV